MPRGQLVQLNGVTGPGIKITCNVDDETSPGYLIGPEAHINIFKSAGTSTSPIEIAYNKVRGGGPSQSGGGILPGDNTASYVTVHDNIAVDPGQYGIALSSGSHIKVLNNKVWSGLSHAWSNVGMFPPYAAGST